MKQPVERRLAAILAADVACYSRLMGEDEEGRTNVSERRAAETRRLWQFGRQSQEQNPGLPHCR
jgi:hypothetical protein